MKITSFAPKTTQSKQKWKLSELQPIFGVANPSVHLWQQMQLPF